MPPKTAVTRIPKAKKEIVAISVKLEVITPDKLRKIIFGLTKGTDDNGVTTWTINFELHDRAKPADPFSEVIKLDVMVKVKNHALAEETAAKGMNEPQVEHVITRAAPAAAKAKAVGVTPATERAVEGTLTARKA